MDKESVVLGCGCEVFGDEAEELKQRFRLLRLLIVSTALSMPLLWDLPPRFQFVLATVLQFGPGLYFLRNAIRGLKNRSLGMDLLVALSTTAIYVYSTVVAFTVTENIKLYYLCDGVLISLLLFGRYLESVAIYQSGEAVRGLLRLQPKTAIVVRDGLETEIDAAEIVSGDTILLRPGERISADGKILEGSCLVDESLLTGESEPADAGLLAGYGAADAAFCLSRRAASARLDEIPAQARSGSGDVHGAENADRRSLAFAGIIRYTFSESEGFLCR